MSLSLSLLLVYSGFYLFIVFLSLSIACGLYYLAELIEEYTVTTKKFLGLACRAELLIHLLLFIDRPPFYCILLGFGAHITYMRLLKRFPYIQLSSSEGLISTCALVLNSAAWLFQYWRSRYTVEYISAFMLITTWIVPFILFLGISGDQNVLPGAGGYPHSPAPAGVDTSYTSATQRQHRGFALRIFDILRKKRDEVLPDVVVKFPASTGMHPKEKI